MIKDIRFALRTLVKKPGFVIIAVMTLALGIGGSTSIFTVVDAALLRGLPYKSPEQLYHVWEQVPRQEFPKREMSYPDYQDYQQNNVFEGLAAYTGGGGVLLSGTGETESVAGPRVTANFFQVLGVDPILGRTFRQVKINRVAQELPSSITACGKEDSAAIPESSVNQSRLMAKRTR